MACEVVKRDEKKASVYINIENTLIETKILQDLLENSNENMHKISIRQTHTSLFKLRVTLLSMCIIVTH